MLMVDDLYERLGLSSVIGPMKAKGVDLDALTRALLAYKLGDNHSILRAGEWLNSPAVLEQYQLKKFDQRTLYRAVELLGQHRDRIIVALQDAMLRLLDLPNTDILLDWTSVVVWGRQAALAKRGYSRDGRPEERQVTIGVAQLAPPLNLPIALTVQAGNMNDCTHFHHTYAQARRVLRDDSLVIFDNGAASLENFRKIELDGNDYLTRMELTSSTDKVYATFGGDGWLLADEETCTFVKVRVFPNSVNYYFRSGKLEIDHHAALRRRAERDLADAKAIQQSIENNKGLPRRFGYSNPLVMLKYRYQTKLEFLNDEEAIELLLRERSNGREGCFCLTSNRKGLQPMQALRLYRAKDAIEKLFHSLKGEIEVGPLRVRRDDAVHGAVLLTFIAQVFVCLTRILVKPVQHMATKFIVAALQSLTATVESLIDGRKRRVYSNFNVINTAILADFLAET
jgi:transposase